MQKQINGAVFSRMAIGASKMLDLNREQIDTLNVFPVPDGDTGTNMSLTMQSAIKELRRGFKRRASRREGQFGRYNFPDFQGNMLGT